MATSYLSSVCESASDMWEYILGDPNSQAYPGARYVVAAGVAGLAIYATSKALGLPANSRKKELQGRIEERKKQRAKQIKDLADKVAVNGVLVTPERKKILDLSATDLVENIRNGKLTCVDVLRAYQAKAIEVTREINCVVEFINEAEEWSNAMDMYPNPELPLCGLPVSIKEDFAITGYDNTLGYAKFIGRTQTSDAVVVAILKQLGAVPFCRTNVPQTIMSYACSNPIYGATKNPHDPKRGPGGSSGGEAALIGAGGSLIGIGDDIGGSVRIPAHFSGIASIKPTTGRLSDNGQIPSTPGVQGIRNSPGFMAKDVDTVILGAKAVWSSGLIHQLDPPSLPILWREELFSGKKKLRIGYYDSSNVYPPTPGVKRAIRLAVEALKSAGHDLVPFACPDSLEVSNRIFRHCDADEGKTIGAYLKDEIVDPAVQKKDLPLVYRLPKCLLNVLSPVLGMVMKHHPGPSADHSSYQLWKDMAGKQVFINETISRWRRAKLDLLLAPGFGYPAIPNEYCHTLFGGVIYTALYNHLDFPAGAVPVTKETSEDQAQLENNYDTRGDFMLELTKKVVRGAEGCPLGVQIVGLPWQEELVLRGMKELQDALKTKKK